MIHIYLWGFALTLAYQIGVCHAAWAAGRRRGLKGWPLNVALWSALWPLFWLFVLAKTGSSR